MRSRGLQSFRSRRFCNPVNPDSNSGCHLSSALTGAEKDLTSLIEYGIIINNLGCYLQDFRYAETVFICRGRSCAYRHASVCRGFLLGCFPMSCAYRHAPLLTRYLQKPHTPFKER